MDEGLRKNYETISWEVALRTVTIYIDSNSIKEAIGFANKTIDDWDKEGKKDIIINFKKWLAEKGLSLEG